MVTNAGLCVECTGGAPYLVPLPCLDMPARKDQERCMLHAECHSGSNGQMGESRERERVGTRAQTAVAVEIPYPDQRPNRKSADQEESS